MVECADLQQRRCYPILAAWLADHMEYIEIFNIKKDCCPVCEVTMDQLGMSAKELLVDVKTQPHQRNYRKCAILQGIAKDSSRTKEHRNIAVRKLDERGTRGTPVVLTELPSVQPNLLHTPDLLHGIYLGLLKHLMQWIQGLLKKYKRQDQFDYTWKSMAPYHGISMPNKPYRQVSQWSGNEMKIFGRLILSVLAASLGSSKGSGESQTAKQYADMEGKRAVFRHALQCTKSLIDFHLYAQYKEHSNKTIEAMQRCWADFHETKAVFLEFRGLKSTAKESKLNIQRLRDETDAGFSCPAEDERGTLRFASQILGQKRKRDELTIRREERDARQKAIDKTSHFNFIKMHMPVHYATHVTWLGAIGAYSTEASESAHKQQLKDAYRHSNRNNYIRQIIEYWTRISALKMRRLNMIQWAIEGVYTEDVTNALNLLPSLGRFVCPF